MATSGDPLAHCESLVDFLKVMYDVLETHRWAVSERGILHRDISIANILINPRSARKSKPYKGKWPKYITQVLEGVRTRAASLALLIDLDNGTKYPKSTKFMEKLTQLRARTGTPRYIARSVSLGRILSDNTNFEPMPELTGEAKTLYQKAHCAKAYPFRHFVDNENTTHGGAFHAKTRREYEGKSQRQVDAFSHHPRHDAESVFWCMVAFLLQALPLAVSADEEEEDDVNNAAYNRKWKCFAYHEISPDATGDSRTGFFADRHTLDQSLHERLVRAAPLLSELALQVHPEYALLSPPPDTFHLHEAMQRIIFKYIHQWESEGFDVKFNTQRTRDTNPIEINILPAVASHTLNCHNPKRGAGTLEKLEMSESKRLRATAS